MTWNVPHRIQCRGESVTAIRARIEGKLGVETTARPEGNAWAVYFDAPADVNVDFLRPDVLPPLPRAAGTGCTCRSGNLTTFHDVGCGFQPFVPLP